MTALLVGAVLGLLSGLGVGGGSLLIVWLLFAVNMPPAAARTVNLMFFLAAALSASLLRLFRRKLRLKPLLPGIVTGGLAAALTSLLGAGMDAALLKKAFGLLLLAVGLRELFYRPRKAR